MRINNERGRATGWGQHGAKESVLSQAECNAGASATGAMGRERTQTSPGTEDRFFLLNATVT